MCFHLGRDGRAEGPAAKGDGVRDWRIRSAGSVCAGNFDDP